LHSYLPVVSHKIDTKEQKEICSVTTGTSIESFGGYFDKITETCQKFLQAGLQIC